MKKRQLTGMAAGLLVALLAGGAWSVRAEAQEGSADVYVTVVRETNGKPIRNASVILHEVRDDGRQRRGGVQLKTDAKGRASYQGVPYGTLRVQVIAEGHRTYGEDHQVNEPKLEVLVKLERPKKQHSIYE